MKSKAKIELTRFVACLCEGAAEKAIINCLLDSEKLIFSREQLLERKPIRCRDAKKFQARYLNKEFSAPLSIVRILDSRKETFKLEEPYKSKVSITNVVTAPEIEILIILAEGKFDEYKKSKKKPSDFCKQNLKMSNVKSEAFVSEYFSDVDKLIKTLQTYKQMCKSRKSEFQLLDLLVQFTP